MINSSLFDSETLSPHGQLYQLSGSIFVVLAVVSVLWCCTVAHLFNVFFVNPQWPVHCLPYENVFYLMFSTSVADILQSICLLTGGLSLVFSSSFPLLLRKLFYLVLILSRSARVSILVCVSVRMWYARCWSHTTKVTLVYLIWMVVILTSFLLCYQCGFEQFDLASNEYYEPLSWWRYVVLEAVGFITAPVLLMILYGLCGRDEVCLVQEEKRRKNSLSVQLQDISDQIFNNSEKPTRSDLKKLGDIKRQLYLKKWNTARGYSQVARQTPSAFTLRNMWTLENTLLDDEASDIAFEYPDQSIEGTLSKDFVFRVSCEGVQRIRRRLNGYMTAIIVIQCVFSLLSLCVHIVGDISHRPFTTSTTSSLLVAEEMLNIHPILNAIAFSMFFSGFYKHLRLNY